MTKQVKLLMYGILFLLLLTALAMIVEKKYSVTELASHREPTVAVEQQPKPAETAKVEQHSGTAGPLQAPHSVASRQSQAQTAVPQAQIDLVNRREEARQRVNEMLKVRAETMCTVGA